MANALINTLGQFSMEKITKRILEDEIKKQAFVIFNFMRIKYPVSTIFWHASIIEALTSK